jgi:hypothetical protein
MKAAQSLLLATTVALPVMSFAQSKNCGAIFKENRP